MHYMEWLLYVPLIQRADPQEGTNGDAQVLPFISILHHSSV